MCVCFFFSGGWGSRLESAERGEERILMVPRCMIPGCSVSKVSLRILAREIPSVDCQALLQRSKVLNASLQQSSKQAQSLS